MARENAEITNFSSHKMPARWRLKEEVGSLFSANARTEAGCRDACATTGVGRVRCIQLQLQFRFYFFNKNNTMYRGK